MLSIFWLDFCSYLFIIIIIQFPLLKKIKQKLCYSQTTSLLFICFYFSAQLNREDQISFLLSTLHLSGSPMSTLLQVASLQAELSVVQTQLINSRFAMANALQQQHHVAMLQPAYSNNSSASTNFINMSSFTSNFDLVTDTAPSSHSMEPLHISQPSHDEEEDEEESQLPGVIFANEVLHRRWINS